MKPGEVVSTWGEGGSGLGVVLATSRHKATVEAFDAMWTLAEHAVEHFGWDDTDEARKKAVARVAAHIGSMQRPYYWHSVTATELAEGLHCCENECEPGSWCTEGSGQAWVRVLTVDFSVVDALLDQGAA